MSYNTWPVFAGRGWGIKKRPITRTIVQTADGGQEFRLARYQSQLYEFDIEIPYLPQADFGTLQGFFMTQGGPLLPFYFAPDNDNGVVAQPFATTDGATTQWQLVKPYGIYTEPVQGVNGTPSIYANGTQIYGTGTGTPATPTLGQVSGGSKSARTYYVRTEYVDALGNPSAASAEASLAISASKLLTVTSPAAAPGAVAWQVFISTTTNSEQLAAQQNIGTSYTEPAGTLPANGPYSATDHTAFVVSPSGLVTFGAHGNAGVTLTWTGGYFYLVRFKDDQLEIAQTLNQIYEATTITLRSVR